MKPVNKAFSNDTVQVLRRRAKQLHEQDGYSADFVSVFLSAADELIVRRRCETDIEREVIETTNDNRLLGRRMSNLAGFINESSMSTALKAKCGQELRLASLLVKAGNKRRIIALSLEPGTTMAEFMIEAKRQYELHAVAADVVRSAEEKPSATEV